MAMASVGQLPLSSVVTLSGQPSPSAVTLGEHLSSTATLGGQPSSLVVTLGGHMSSTATIGGHVSSMVAVGGQQMSPIVPVGGLMPLVSMIGEHALLPMSTQSIGGSSHASTLIASQGSASDLSLEGSGNTPDSMSEPEVVLAAPATNNLGVLFLVQHYHNLLNNYWYCNYCCRNTYSDRGHVSQPCRSGICTRVK
jgi:hypothetical protein